MTYSILITITVLLGQAGRDGNGEQVGEPSDANRALIKQYYSRWVGVQAPELGQYGLDHDNKLVSLSSFRGRHVLLFSFDAGDFNRPPNEQALLANLRSLDKARKLAGRDKLAVVGFTQGMAFVWPGEPRPGGELGRLSDFPMISAVSGVNRKFNEPYNVLLEPGAILIDGRGVLRAFYDHAPSERELLDVAALSDWEKPTRKAPSEDPWTGKGPPRPTHKATLAWARALPKVVGMTEGDWDLRGSNDLIAAVGHGYKAGELVVIDPADGKERHKFPTEHVSKSGTYSLGWATLGKEKSAVFIFGGGWPSEVPLIGRDGSAVGNLEEFAAGVDCVAWADLDGAGSNALIVGLNGGGGIHAFDNGGRKRWGLTPDANIWTVAGIDAIGGRPGRAIYSDGLDVFVLNPQGGSVGKISTEGHPVMKLAASEVDKAGERQVVAVWQAVVGTVDYATATDLSGKVLWKYPVDAGEMATMSSSIIAADVTGDGTKEWIIAPSWRSLVILDTRGRLLAKLEPTGRWWGAWTAIERVGKPGWIVASDSGKLFAFTLAPSN